MLTMLYKYMLYNKNYVIVLIFAKKIIVYININKNINNNII